VVGVKIPKAFSNALNAGSLLTFSDVILKVKSQCDKGKGGLKEQFLLEKALVFFTKTANDTIKNPDTEKDKIEGELLLGMISNISSGVLIPLKAKEPIINTQALTDFSDWLKAKAREAKHGKRQQVDILAFQELAKLEAERLLRESLERTRQEIKELKEA